MQNVTTIARPWARRSSRRGWLALGAVVALAAAMIVLVGQQPQHASAASVAGQCNGEMNGGGTEVACTVTVVNHLTAAGELAASPPSTLTLTRCVGASGPLSTLTCTTTTTTSTQPVTTIQQCNGSGNGGGGAVICNVTISNRFSGSPAAITPATVYQCVGSVITGTGAPGTCTPANTPGVTSVTAATVGQCNGSGNGGGSVGFTCSVTGGSTMTATLAVNVDQCNGSGNGGGALVTCQASVTNDVAASTVTVTATTTATTTVSGTTSPTASLTGTLTPSPAASSTGTLTPSPTASLTATPTRTPTGTIPRDTPSPAVSPPVPRPPAVGNTGVANGGGTSPALVSLLLFAAAGLGLTGLRLASHRRSR